MATRIICPHCGSEESTNVSNSYVQFDDKGIVTVQKQVRACSNCELCFITRCTLEVSKVVTDSRGC